VLFIPDLETRFINYQAGSPAGGVLNGAGVDPESMQGGFLVASQTQLPLSSIFEQWPASRQKTPQRRSFTGSGMGSSVVVDGGGGGGEGDASGPAGASEDWAKVQAIKAKAKTRTQEVFISNWLV